MPFVANEVGFLRMRSVKVMILWGANVLHVSHLAPPRSFHVGEEPPHKGALDFLLPADKLGTSCWPVVIADGASIVLVVPPSAWGHVHLPGEPPISLETARQRGHSSPELDGGRRLYLPPKGTARLEIGQFVFLVAVVDAERLPKGARSNPDWPPVGYFGLSLLAHSALLAALCWLAPPDELACELDTKPDQMKLMRHYLYAASGRQQEQPQSQRSSGARRQQFRESRAVLPLLEPIGPGCFERVSPSGRGTTPSGRDTSLGLDGIAAEGLWGDDFPDVLAVVGWRVAGSADDGLRLQGIGEGVRCRGENSVVGSLGSPTRDEPRPRPRPVQPHRRPTRLRMLDLKVDGLLPPELILYEMSRSQREFGLCYEKGLARNPNLRGRTSIRFVIGRNGSVYGAANAGSDLPDREVVLCVIGTYYRVGFPEPERGTVTVLSHILFAPG